MQFNVIAKPSGRHGEAEEKKWLPPSTIPSDVAKKTWLSSLNLQAEAEDKKWLPPNNITSDVAKKDMAVACQPSG